VIFHCVPTGRQSMLQQSFTAAICACTCQTVCLSVHLGINMHVSVSLSACFSRHVSVGLAHPHTVLYAWLQVAAIICSFPEHYPCVVLSAMGKVCTFLPIRLSLALYRRAVGSKSLYSLASLEKEMQCMHSLSVCLPHK
jgi:hypothetical protein